MVDAPYSEGSFDSKVCIIGEAPGSQEVAMRKPFVGGSGDVLNRMLLNAGILRSQCRIDNVMQIQPPNNDISYYITMKGNKVSESSIFIEHKNNLIRRLWETKSNVFVPLGNIPLWVLTGLNPPKITKRRGSILQGTLIHPDTMEIRDIKVIPTIHPAASLREFSHQALIRLDIKRVAEQMHTPKIQLMERNLNINMSYDACIAALDYVYDNASIVGIDIEVLNKSLSMMSFAMSPSDCFVVPFNSMGVDTMNPYEEGEIMKRIERILYKDSIIKVGHNIVFDATFLYMKYGIITRNVEDTMIACAILYPTYPKGLDFVTSIYCDGEPYYKDDGKKFYKNPYGDDRVFRRYNAMDSAVCIESWFKMKEDLISDGNWTTYEHQRNLVQPLIFLQAMGIRMDKDGLVKAGQESTLRIKVLQEELENIMGKGFNFNSPKQMQHYFYEIKKYPIQYKSTRTPGGIKKTVTTEETALKKLKHLGSPEAGTLIDLRGESKLLSTYYNVLLDDDNRLRCSFNPVGTEQGRLSSSQTIFDTGANLQNQPPEMKRLMLADPGYFLINQDASQAENRVVAYVAYEPRMIEAFEKWIDLHSQTAGLIYNKAPADVSREKDSSGLSERDRGKRANHGLNYGLGYKKFAAMNDLSDDEALFITSSYHQVYPAIREWHRSIQEQLRVSRTLTNCFGRIRVFTGRYDDTLFKEAYSFIPQSTVADLINRYGVCFLWYTLIVQEHKDIIFLNQVHDSLVYEISMALSNDEVINILWRCRQSMETPLKWKNRVFSIPTDTKIGFNLDEEKMIEIKASKTQTFEEFHSTTLKSLQSLREQYGATII